LKKRTLMIHYPKLDRIRHALDKQYTYPGTSLEESQCNKFAWYKLNLQLKFKEDFGEMAEFLKERHIENPDQPGTFLSSIEFDNLHLVITEDTLEEANKLIKVMKEVKLLNDDNPDSYNFLDSGNYCRAANMGDSKLVYETETIIGAEPSAFFDKIETSGLIDVRGISKCPVADIKFPVRAITTDAEFCDNLGEDALELHSVFSNAVNKAIFEDKVDKIAERIDDHLEHLSASFPNLNAIELKVEGSELKDEMISSLFSNKMIKAVEYNGTESDDTIKITGENIFFVVGNSSDNRQLRAEKFMVEFPADAYTYSNDLVIINPKQLNIEISGIENDETYKRYSEVAEQSIYNHSLIIHKHFIQNIHFTSIITKDHEIVPTQSLTIYLDEEDSYDEMGKYLAHKISDTLPVTLELDMAFIQNMEESKKITSEIFDKMLVKVHIVMEMYFPEYVDYLYSLMQNKMTLVEVTPIFHQDCKKTIELVNKCPHVKQWILDVRQPNENLYDDMRSMLAYKSFEGEHDNKGKCNFVLRKVFKQLIEFRFPTSFEVSPM
jgi:hypothetical protein